MVVAEGIRSGTEAGHKSKHQHGGTGVEMSFIIMAITTGNGTLLGC
jgi:hypothetical protein